MNRFLYASLSFVILALIALVAKGDPLLSTFAVVSLGAVIVNKPMSAEERLKAEASKAKSNVTSQTTSTDPFVRVAHLIKTVVRGLTFWTGRDGRKYASGTVDADRMLKEKVDKDGQPTGEPVISFLGQEFPRFLDLFASLADIFRENGKETPVYTIGRRIGDRVVPVQIKFLGLQKDGNLQFSELDGAVGSLSGGTIRNRLELDIPRRSSGTGFGMSSFGNDSFGAFGLQGNSQDQGYDESELDNLKID